MSKTHEYAHEIGSFIEAPGQKFLARGHLGAGGMGETYWVEDHLGRFFALKRPSRALIAQHPEFKPRFVQEARAVARLSHPNIVHVVDVSELLDGTPIFWMDLLRGETLRDALIRDGKIKVSTTLEIASRVLFGLDLAHSSNVIHRDIKPENIFLAWDIHGNYTPIIIDFGAFKLASDKTRAKRLYGTARYIAPELFEGGSAGPAADVYSVGVVAFEALTGVTPFHSFGPFYEDMLKTLRLKAPSLALFGKFAPRLENAIASALDKDPTKRPHPFVLGTELRDINREYGYRTGRHQVSTGRAMMNHLKEVKQVTEAYLSAPGFGATLSKEGIAPFASSQNLITTRPDVAVHSGIRECRIPEIKDSNNVGKQHIFIQPWETAALELKKLWLHGSHVAQTPGPRLDFPRAPMPPLKPTFWDRICSLFSQPYAGSDPHEPSTLRKK